MLRKKVPAVAALAATGCGVLLTSATASAGITPLIEDGLYELCNHPDGSAASPYYGLRLDGLYEEYQVGPNTGDPISGSKKFTFDFEHVDSEVFMTVTASEIRIFGQAYGGRDTGSSYENDQFLGIYEFDFTYDVGVGVVPGDDDLIVMASTATSTGEIITPLGDTIDLYNKAKNDELFSFRLGDGDNDNGHRGYDGISGWGWLNHVGPYEHPRTSDWLFTAKLVPAPGTAALLTAGIGGLAMRRRR